MVDDKIENDFDVALFPFGDEAIEIRKRAIHRIDVFVVGNVIAEVDLRRRKARGNPNSVDAKILQVIELGGDALEIADAVVVAVSEAARIKLVEDGVLPPFTAFRVDLLLGVSTRSRRAESENQDACCG